MSDKKDLNINFVSFGISGKNGNEKNYYCLSIGETGKYKYIFLVKMSFFLTSSFSWMSEDGNELADFSRSVKWETNGGKWLWSCF